MLALSGTATTAQYQAALDSVTFGFVPSDADPTAGNTDTSRTLTYTVTDGTSSSTPVSSTVMVTHAPPSVTAGSTATYTRGSGAAVVADPSGYVTAPDSSGQIASATVSITAGRGSTDVLAFTPGNGIAGTYNGSTGVLSLTGNATAAQYQAAIDSVTFSTGDASASGTRSLSYVVNDGTANSAAATSTVSVTVPTPAISGTVAGQAVSDRGTVDPFSGTSVTDTAGEADSATIMLTNGGAATDADGVLSGTGLTKTGTGSYALAAASPATLTGELQALVFTPTARQVAPGGTVTTAFGLSLSDTGGGSAIDNTTTVTATAANDPPTISGQQASETTTDQVAILPFASVSIADPNASQTQTATVTLSPSGDGTLSNLGTGTLSADGLTYTVSGTAGDVTTALDALTFTPKTHQVAVGSTVQTTFALSDTDGTATAAGNSVVNAVAVAGTPTANSQSDAVGFNTAAAVTLTGSDPDNPPLSLTYTVATGPTHGTLSGTGPNLTYTPSTSFYGTDSFTFTDNNGQNTSAPATVTLNVAAGTPTLTGSGAATTTNETAVAPFGNATVTDANAGASDTVTIMTTGKGGTFSEPAGAGGTLAGGGTTYTLTASARTITAALQALLFTPTAGAAGSANVTDFALTDTSTAGPSSTIDANFSVTDFDTPGQPPAPTLAATSDSGVSKSDGVTNVAEPTFTGTAGAVVAGATVVLYDGKTQIGTTTANPDGSYSVAATTALTQGANSITVTQTANGLASAMSPATTVTLDTTTPSVTSETANPATGDYTVGQTLSFTLATSEAVTVSGTPTLTLNDGGSANYVGGSGSSQLTFMSVVAAGQNASTLQVTGVALPNGATIRDGAGNAADLSGAVRTLNGLQIDTRAPAAPATLSDASVTSGFVDAANDTASQTLAGTAEANSTVKIYDGTALLGAITANGSGGFSYTLGHLANGRHSLTATATDGAGNTGPASAALPFTVDTVAPMVTVSTYSASPTNASPISFSFTFSEPVTGFVPSDVTVAGGTLVSFSGSGTNYTGNVTAAGAGTVTVSVAANEAQDSATNGNVASNSVSVQYIPPATAAPVLTAPVDHAFTNVATPAYTGLAPSGSTVTVYVDGTPIGTTTATRSGVFSLAQPTTLTQGSHTTYATAQTGGSTVSPNSNTDTFTVDTTQPMITTVVDSGTGIDANSNGDLDAGKTVTLTVTTSEPVAVIPGSGGSTPTLTLSDGATATYTGLTNAATGTLTFSYTVAAGQDAAKLAVSSVNANGATVTDRAGNPISTSLAGASVPSGTLIVDTTPPAAVDVTDTVAQNAAATPIDITAPSDNLTPAGSLAIAAGTLPTDGTVTLGDGTTRIVAGQSLTATQLTGLEFTPTPGVSNQSSTFTYTVTDGAGNATEGTATLKVGGPGAPTITGTHAAADAAEAAVPPFAGVRIADPSGAAGATDSLAITLVGGGGLLTGNGLSGSGNSYTLAPTDPTTLSSELDALQFTPANPTPNATATTTFTLTATSSAGPSSATNTGTIVTDIAAAVPPTITNTSPPATSTNESPATPFTGATVSDPDAAGNGNNTPGSATDTLTIALQGGTGTLADAPGTTGGSLKTGTAPNTYTLTGTGAAITTELDGLVFTPAKGAANSVTTTTFQLSDVSSVGGASKTDATSRDTDTDSAAAPTVTGGTANQGTTSEATVNGVFAGVTVADPNAGSPTETVTVTVGGSGGTLSGGGIAPGGTARSYTLSGTVAQVNAALGQVSFTPTAGQPNTTSTTTFSIVDASGAGTTSAADTTPSVIDIDPAVAPTVTGGTASQATTGEAPVAGVFGGVTVADPNAGSPSETVTVTVGGAGGMLSGGGIAPGGTAGSYTLSGTVAQVNAALGQVAFTPNAGQANSMSTTTFSIVDQSSATTTASAPDTAPIVVDTDPAVVPIVTGGGSTATAQNASVHPFAAASVTDSNANSSDTLSIQVQGSGTLSGTGLNGGMNGLYTLSGSAGIVTGELQGLTFTPAANGPGTTTTTTFTLTDTTSAGTAATNSGTGVTDTVAPPTTDTVSISPLVSYEDGVFTLTGTASSTAGVKSVEISAVENYGARVDLGAATVNADGTFMFHDNIGANLQGFLRATETDNAGGTSTSADPLFSLTGGLGPDYGAGRQRRYTADGEALTADTLFRPDGTKTATVVGQGQTLASAYDDTFNNAKQADTTFVFDPGFSLDVVNGFRVRGDGHDTLSFKGSDFGSTPEAQLGALLANSYNAGGSLYINDPTSGDAVQLKGITKAQIVHNERDITFHA